MTLLIIFGVLIVPVIINLILLYITFKGIYKNPTLENFVKYLDDVSFPLFILPIFSFIMLLYAIIQIITYPFRLWIGRVYEKNKHRRI